MKYLIKCAALLMSLGFVCVPMQVSGDEKPLPDDKYIIENTECGDDMVFAYDSESQTLTISGSGKMWDFEQFHAPWHSFAYFAENLAFEGEIESIGDYAFCQFSSLKSVMLPPTVNHIGKSAFQDCTLLQTVSFPDGLTEIGDSAFYGDSLNTAVLPDTVRSIGAFAFENNKALTAVTLHEGIKFLGARCFADCLSLNEIQIPDSAQEIGDGLLDGDAAWFSQHQTLGEDFVIFGDGYLYHYFGDDPSVIVPDHVKHISSGCFTEPVCHLKYYSAYGYLLTVQENLPRTDITSVTLPDSLTELPEKLFFNMTGLQSLRLGAKVSVIPYGLCMQCPNLTALEMPDSVQEIGALAFAKNAWLKEAGEFVVLGDGLLYLYQGTKKVITLPEGIKAICSNAFSDYEVVAVTCPTTLRKLFPHSMTGGSLTEVRLNEGIEVLSKDAFVVTRSFSQVVIPNSVIEIDPDAFQYSEPFTVVGEKGTAAEQFAAEKELPFCSAAADPNTKDLTLHPETDCWSFQNSTNVFGAQHYLSDADKAAVDALGFIGEEDWGGSCYGMCAGVILAKNGIIAASQLAPGAADIASLSPSPAVQSFINYYQYTQNSPQFRHSVKENRPLHQIYKMIQIAQEIPHGASPFMICFKSPEINGHAVVGYGCETGEWQYLERKWTARIMVYDPNVTQSDASRFVYYDPETLDICIPHYGLLWADGHKKDGFKFVVCNELDVLNAYPYAFADATKKGDLNADTQITTADMMLLRNHLLCRDNLSDAAAHAAELSGDGMLTAVDLTLLKRMVLQAK